MIYMRRADLRLFDLRLTQLHGDLTELATAFGEHIKRHEQDRQMAVAARRWYIGTILAAVGVGTPLIILALHATGH